MQKTNINLSDRGRLTEMEFFRAWKHANQKLLQDYHQEGLEAAERLFVDPMDFDEFCAITFMNHSWMVPSINN